MSKFVHPSAQIGAGTQLGFNSVVHDDAPIVANCRIRSGLLIHPGTIIRSNVRLDDNSVVGKLPMQAALSAVTSEQELAPCMIGNDCMIGAMTVIYRGCVLG